MFALFTLGTTEILVLLAIGVLLFGNRLPDLGRTFGRTLVDFKKAVTGGEDDLPVPPR
jgi:sec-independent protein translocase protein TatA